MILLCVYIILIPRILQAEKPYHTLIYYLCTFVGRLGIISSKFRKIMSLVERVHNPSLNPRMTSTR